MIQTHYTRPTKTSAASLGQQARTRWSTALRKKASHLLMPIEFMAAAVAIEKATRSRPGYQRAAWTSVRTRIDQVAVLEVLRQRHLTNTGKEISRAETLAALMAAGLPVVLEQKPFCRPQQQKD